MRSQVFNQPIDVSALLNALYIDAKRSHKGEWWARCPTGTHPDKTPSWSIKDEPGSEKHGFHKCLGCGFSGGPSTLVQEIIGITHFSAIEFLKDIERNAAPINRVDWIVKNPTKAKFKLPNGVITPLFDDWISPPKKYIESRGLGSVVDDFGLGYAITGRCTGRIVIPVYNANGVLVSYTSRTYIDDEKRYKEPTNEEGADKNAIFGEHLWNDPNRLRGVVAIVEGAFNAMAIKVVYPTLTVAAIMGSDVTPTHVLKFTSNFSHALIMTDSDHAGEVAAEKLETSLCRHMQTTLLMTNSKNDWNDEMIKDKFGLWKQIQRAIHGES